MKKILLIATGGTISCGSGDALRPEHGGGELLSAALSEKYDIETLDLFALDSTDITPAHWKKLCHAVTEAVFSGKYGGVVILHGTDTLEYTAALLYHTVEPEIPVIITGSMLPAEAEGSDAPQNTRDALLCAEDPAFAGVYVVFGGRVIGGGEAVKRFSDRADSFRSFSGGDCGCVRENKAVLTRRSVPDKIYAFPENGGNVKLIKLTPFTAAAELRAEGCSGAVIESFGAGGLPAHLTEAAGRLAAQMPVIMTTGCIGGARLNEYEVGKRALELGIIDGGKMSSACALARVFLENGCVKSIMKEGIYE